MLPFLLLLPFLLKKGWGFYGSMSVSTLVMVGLYYLMMLLLGKLGIQS